MKVLRERLEIMEKEHEDGTQRDAEMAAKRKPKRKAKAVEQEAERESKQEVRRKAMLTEKKAEQEGEPEPEIEQAADSLMGLWREWKAGN